MSKRTPKVLMAAIVSGIICLGAALSAADTITVRTDFWPPFICSQDSKDPGYYIEVIKAIFDKQGYKIDYQPMPWARSAAEVKDGKFDCVIGASHGDCPDFIFPKEPLNLNENAFFTKKGLGWKYDGIKSLEKVSLGVVQGYSYSPELDEYIAKNEELAGKVQTARGEDAVQRNIKKLAAGRLDVVLENRDVFIWAAKELGVEKDSLVVASSFPDKDDDQLFVAFSPAKDKLERSKKLAEIFDAGFAELRKSGELDKLKAKYGVK